METFIAVDWYKNYSKRFEIKKVMTLKSVSGLPFYLLFFWFSSIFSLLI